MREQDLQQLVEDLSNTYFNRPFLHKARFNPRLRTTGGRYFLRSHDIEINPKMLEAFGEDELIGIIKHELCHYHLHILKRGYQHKDQDFKQLLAKLEDSDTARSLKQRKIPRNNCIPTCAQTANKPTHANAESTPHAMPAENVEGN